MAEPAAIRRRRPPTRASRAEINRTVAAVHQVVPVRCVESFEDGRIVVHTSAATAPPVPIPGTGQAEGPPQWQPGDGAAQGAG